MNRQRHTRVGGEIIPRDETFMTIIVTMKVQARDRRKKGAKSLTLQKDCKAMVFLRIVGGYERRNGCLAVRTLIVKKVLPQISPKIKGFVLCARNEG
jgi:hypothetical protein